MRPSTSCHVVAYDDNILSVSYVALPICCKKLASVKRQGVREAEQTPLEGQVSATRKVPKGKPSSHTRELMLSTH